MKPINSILREDGKRVKLPKNQHKSKVSLSQRKRKILTRERRLERMPILKRLRAKTKGGYSEWLKNHN